MKKKLLDMLIAVSALALAVSGYFAFGYIRGLRKADAEYEALALLAETDGGDARGGEASALEALAALNPDCIAWITVGGTDISYPVMQSVYSPNYYLRRNFYKEYSLAGSIFLSEACSLGSSDNLVVYGHNMPDGTMFSDLLGYLEQSYCEEHKTITLITPAERLEYEVFAVVQTDIGKDDFAYYSFIKASDAEEYDAFIAQCMELSLYDIGSAPVYGQQILSLSTCRYAWRTDERLVVFACRAA